MTDIHETPPRLSPPPKVGREAPGSRAADATSRRARADRSLLYWLTAFVFLALAATAVGVFVFLPDWVSQSDSTATVTAPTDAPSAEFEPETQPTEPAAAALEPESVEPASTPPVPQPQHQQPPQPPRTAARTDPPPKPVDPAAGAFAEAMTDGLSRLATGDLGAAEQAFRQALTVRPGASAATDGLARVESERQLLTIADHRGQAATHEQQERWSAAVAEYAAVLALDPTIRFAQEGYAAALSRQDLNDRIEGHSAHPGRLSSDAVLDDARSVLSEARQIGNQGQVLTQQIERLANQIDVAATPVRVVLISDEETDVLVFKVGRLGTFARRALDLRPGSYTVVGTRAGYRDVRRTLEVSPHKADISLTIRCEEKL